MPYSFEKFSHLGEKYDARVSVTKSWFIGLPREFCKLHQIEKFGYVELFFDLKNMALAMRFSTDKVEHAYRVNFNKESSSASISARSFFRHYGIDPARYAAKYDAKKVADETHGELLVVELKEHEKT